MRDRRDHYYLATKAGRYGVAEFDFSPSRIERSLGESQRRLGVDHVDIFQLHDIEFGDLEQVVEESLPLLARLKEQGRIGWFRIGPFGFPLRALAAVKIASIKFRSNGRRSSSHAPGIQK